MRWPSGADIKSQDDDLLCVLAFLYSIRICVFGPITISFRTFLKMQSTDLTIAVTIATMMSKRIISTGKRNAIIIYFRFSHRNNSESKGKHTYYGTWFSKLSAKISFDSISNRCNFFYTVGIDESVYRFYSIFIHFSSCGFRFCILILIRSTRISYSLSDKNSKYCCRQCSNSFFFFLFWYASYYVAIRIRLSIE